MAPEMKTTGFLSDMPYYIMLAMKAKDSIKLWFDTLVQDGECMDLTVLKIDQSGVEEFNFPHGEVDGIGAFLNIHKKSDSLQVYTKMRHKRPWYHYLWGFLMYTKRLPFRSAKWKNFNKNWRQKYWQTKPFARAYTVFSKEETRQIKQLSKGLNVSLNSHLLFCLNKVLTNLQEPGKSIWLVPVSMRASLDEEIVKNEVGFTDAYCGSEDRVQDIDRQIKKRLKNLEHLGGVIGVSLGVFIGPWLLKKLVLLNKHLQVRTGVFTNLGEGRDPESKNMYSGYPPVIETQPVGALAGIWNDSLTLALHFHPALELSKEQAEQILAQWREAALKG